MILYLYFHIPIVCMYMYVCMHVCICSSSTIICVSYTDCMYSCMRFIVFCESTIEIIFKTSTQTFDKNNDIVFVFSYTNCMYVYVCMYVCMYVSALALLFFVFHTPIACICICMYCYVFY